MASESKEVSGDGLPPEAMAILEQMQIQTDRIVVAVREVADRVDSLELREARADEPEKAQPSTPNVDPKDRLYTPEEAANILGISSWTVRRMLKRREMPYLNVGNGEQRPSYRISRQQLDDFIRSRSRAEYAEPPKPTRKPRRPPPKQYV